MKLLPFAKILSFFNILLVLGESCELDNKCRLVSVDGAKEWANEPGHYLSIQDCVDEAKPGDTCLIQPGRYHEEITIHEKSNIAIRGDISAEFDHERPIIDGTIILNPGNGGDWEEDTVNGNKVCIGMLDIKDDKHPFQLFLKDENEDYDMMTIARWPNALWTDRNPETGVPQLFNNTFWGKSAEGTELGKMVDREDADGISPLASSGLDMTGAMAILNIGSFRTYHRLITSHTPGDNFFMYDDHDITDKHGKAEKSQYYIDSKEELMDNPGEWHYNKDTNILKFMPPSGSCPEANSDKVRGRVIDYAISIGTMDDVIISDLDFFASNILASPETKHEDDINGLYLDSLNLMYPVSSHRMLLDDSLPKTTNIHVRDGTKLSIENCVFFGGEGTALNYDGKETKISNNLFQWNDWSGVMNGDGAGTVWTGGHQKGEHFNGNTFWYNGASAGFRPGEAAIITENLFVGQRIGNIMNDGSEVQLMTGRARYLHFERNWMFDSSVSGVRIDSSGDKHGYNCTIAENVAWNTGGYMLKGDYHNITGNLALVNNEENKNEGGIRVIYILRQYYDYIMNNNTLVENNLAWMADGGKDLHCTKHDVVHEGRYMLAGLKSNNYYGNSSFGCHQDGYDGSVVLDGETVPDASYTDLLDLLVDTENYDFRPKPDTILTSTGMQIGPYASKYSNGDKYFIPGRRLSTPSHPIPRNEAVVKMRDDLIFKPAYRCNDVGFKHKVFMAENDSDFPSEPVTEIEGDGNVVVFKDIGFEVKSGTSYKWYVSCEGPDDERVSDTWLFQIE